jgi:hypothetical protein
MQNRLASGVQAGVYFQHPRHRPSDSLKIWHPRAKAVWLVALLLGLAASPQARSGAYSNISEYPVPTPNRFPPALDHHGPDGAQITSLA